MEKARILINEDEAFIGMEIEIQLRSLRYGVNSIVDTGEKAVKRKRHCFFYASCQSHPAFSSTQRAAKEPPF